MLNEVHRKDKLGLEPHILKAGSDLKKCTSSVRYEFQYKQLATNSEIIVVERFKFTNNSRMCDCFKLIE